VWGGRGGLFYLTLRASRYAPVAQQLTKGGGRGGFLVFSKPTRPPPLLCVLRYADRVDMKDGLTKKERGAARDSVGGSELRPERKAIGRSERGGLPYKTSRTASVRPMAHALDVCVFAWCRRECPRERATRLRQWSEDRRNGGLPGLIRRRMNRTKRINHRQRSPYAALAATRAAGGTKEAGQDQRA
jgi:hypothetical protein